MTKSMLLTLGLAIAGQIIYQISQRSVPASASPLLVLTVAYFAAGTLCILLAWPLGAFATGVNWQPALAWPTWLVAAAIVAIEVGYLLAFRSGWTLGTAFATASTVTVVSLALIDWLAHGTTLSTKQLVGIACSCLGVWLLTTARRA